MAENFVDNYIDRLGDIDSDSRVDFHDNPNLRNESQALVYLQTLIEGLIEDGDTIAFLLGLQHILEKQRCSPHFINRVKQWKGHLLKERELQRHHQQLHQRHQRRKRGHR